MKHFEMPEVAAVTHTMRVTPDYLDKQKFPFLKMPYAFNLCGGGPDKSTAIVLEAFSKLPQYTVVIMCNWNYSNHGVWLRKMYSSFTNIIMLDAATSLRETMLLQSNCFLYLQGEIHNSNPAALPEAMQSGLPVVAFADEANKTVTGNKAFYFETAEDLKVIILQKTITDLKEMGTALKTIAADALYQMAHSENSIAALLN
jgi:glycosyltransferase involved in cell wall biosynthesis